jgi:hypothetical protein
MLLSVSKTSTFADKIFSLRRSTIFYINDTRVDQWKKISVEITARHEIGQNFTLKFHRLYISYNMTVQSVTKYNTSLFKYKVPAADQSSDRNKLPASEDHRSCPCGDG